MKKRLIVGNWKQHPATLTDAKRLYQSIKTKASKAPQVDIRIAAPHTFIQPLTGGKKTSKPQIGVQDVSASLGGAYTGEVSAAMAANVGARFAIVGHSERRALGETNAIVNKKVLAALSAGLEVILCVGEQTRDHDGFYLGYIKDEIDSAFLGVLPRDLPRIVIAYEPIFAIGKTAADAMSGQDVHEMVIYIRKCLSEKFNRSRADATTILYGGSVEGTNAESILREGMVDGFLVGRASLDPQVFMEIIQFAKYT